nr:asparagine synthase-related protein [uncultured Psychrobacter sp.]
MPGIYGVVSKKDAKSNLQSMSKSMYLYDHFIQDEIFYNDSIAASRTHIGKLGASHSPIKLGDSYIWVEGEAYNINEIASRLFLKATDLPNLLLQAAEMGRLKTCLNQLDGYFCAAIYNQKKQKVSLISDRYGMRLLYWYHKDGVFAWGSEVKAILAIKDSNKELNISSFQCFMDLGHLLDEHTWFNNIRLINPATIIEYDINSNTATQDYYWKWSSIVPSTLSFEAAVEQLGYTLIEAVEKRFDNEDKISIALSGGLDSRAIFAALNHVHPNYNGYTYTFGIPKCQDIDIAKQVSSLSKNWNHQIFYFDSLSWFQARFEKVWNTDGMQDMQHMHGIEFFKEIPQNMNINLNGYGGGLFTGEWVDNKKLNQPVNKEFAISKFGKHSYLAPFDSDFYHLNHVEPYIYMNRNRRATNMGTVNYLISMEQRKPLMDNKIVELLLSLPDEYRLSNRLYSAMLQKHFPKYFKNIPWSRTGKPVSITKKATIPTRAINKAKREFCSLLGIQSNKNYTNYTAWIRDKEVSTQLLDLLNPKNAEYTRLTNDDLSKRWLEPHLKNKKINYANQILRAATIEIYLRQVFREKNR